MHIYIYSEGTCPRSLLYYLFEAPVLGHWAHLGSEKKRPQCRNKKPAKTWGTNHNGLDVQLLSISQKTSKARVTNHNGLDAKILRSSWKTTKAWVANHFGSDAKLLRRSLKIADFFYSLEHFLNSFAAVPIQIAKWSLVAFERILNSFAAKPIPNATPCLVALSPPLRGGWGGKNWNMFKKGGCVCPPHT